MKLTVEQSLNIYPFNQGKLVAGHGGLSRVIESVNVMDAPDIVKWLKKNELLLTTAFVFKGYPEALDDLIRRLHEGGCTALGIKLGRYWKEIPQNLIDAANRYNFPLIALPFDYAFSDLMSSLYRASIGEEVREQLNNVMQKQTQLMLLAFQRPNDHELYEDFAKIVGHPIVILSRQGYVLFNTTGKDEVFWNKQLLQKDDMQKVGIQELQHYQLPIIKNGTKIGTLIIWNGTNAISYEEEELFKQASSILPRYMAKSEGTIKNGWMQQLMLYLQNQISIGSLLTTLESEQMNLPLNHYQCVYTILTNQQVESYWELQEKLEMDQEIVALQGVHLPFERGIFSIYSAKGDPKFGEKYQKLLDESDYKAMVLISREKVQPMQLQEAYSECLEMAQLMRKEKITEGIFYEEDVEIYKLLHYIPDQVLIDYAEKIIGPIRHSKEMVETLELFLEHNGQINEVAKRLFVHRNTIAYRMEKINALLNIEFRNYNDILKLKLIFFAFKRYPKNQNSIERKVI